MQFGNSVKEYIKELQAKGIDIFYLGEGNPECYRLNLKHIGFSKVMGLTRVIGTNIHGQKIYSVSAEEIYVMTEQSVVTKFKQHDTFASADLKNLE